MDSMELKYSILSKDDIPSTIDCVIKVFLYEEPMTRLLRISESEFQVFAELTCKKAAEEKLSFVCKNKDGRVVGFCLNEDLIATPLDSSLKITPKMDPIFDILNQLDTFYLKDKKPLKNKFFHLFMVGTLSEYRSVGIARKLIEKSLTRANKKRFQAVVTEATNFRSQNLLKKYFNFNTLKRISYEKFSFNDKFPFKSLGKESCDLMEWRISNKKLNL